MAVIATGVGGRIQAWSYLSYSCIPRWTWREPRQGQKRDKPWSSPEL